MDITKHQIESVKDIIESHIGKRNQISSGKIGPMIGIHEDATHIIVRSVVREVLEKEKVPIAGGSKGYYLIANRRELHEYIKSLQNRADEIINRIENVTEAFNSYY